MLTSTDSGAEPVDVLVLGDESVLTAADQLAGACEACEITIDAEPQRTLADGLSAAGDHDGPFDIVVLLLGQHEPIPDAVAGFGEIFDRFALVRRIIVLAPPGSGSGPEPLGDHLAAMAAERPNVTISPWASLLADHPDAVAPDNHRLTPAGASLLTYLVASEIAAARPAPGPDHGTPPPMSRPESAPTDEPWLDEAASQADDPGPDRSPASDAPADRSGPRVTPVLLGILGFVALGIAAIGVGGRMRR